METTLNRNLRKSNQEKGQSNITQQIVANSVAFVLFSANSFDIVLLNFILFRLRTTADMSGKKVLFLLMTLVAATESYVSVIDCTGREGQVQINTFDTILRFG